jgi:hypothetical protein
MKNITTILLTLGLVTTSIIAVIPPASAGQEADFKRQEGYRQREQEIFNRPTPVPHHHLIIHQVVPQVVPQVVLIVHHHQVPMMVRHQMFWSDFLCYLALV